MILSDRQRRAKPDGIRPCAPQQQAPLEAHLHQVVAQNWRAILGLLSGFAGGLATAIKVLKLAVRIWGVETEGADCMAKSLAAGEIVTLEAITSIARTLGAPAPSEVTFGLAQQYLEGVTVVPDSEAAEALVFLLERLKVLTEPTASSTLTAADRLRERFSPERHVVLMLCGRNAR